MRLAELQGRMSSAIFRPLTSSGHMRPLRGVEDWIHPNERMSAFERLEVYNRQYWLRLLEALREDFPGLRRLLGKQAFEALCVDYLEAHPPRRFALRDLGDRLPAFIRRRHFQNKRLAWDLTRVEWARLVAFGAAALEPIDPSVLARMRDPVLNLQPHLILLRLTYPVDRRVTWRARPTPGGLRLAVHRVREEIYFKRLDPLPFSVLEALRDARRLGLACDRVLARTPRAERSRLLEDVGSWFRDWAGRGWIVGTQRPGR